RLRRDAEALCTPTRRGSIGGAVVRPARLIFLAFSRLQFPLPRNDPQTDRCTQCRHITSVRVPGHRQGGQPICIENSGNRVSPLALRLSGGRAFASNATPASAGGPDPRTARPRIRTWVLRRRRWRSLDPCSLGTRL